MTVPKGEYTIRQLRRSVNSHLSLHLKHNISAATWRAFCWCDEMSMPPTHSIEIDVLVEAAWNLLGSPSLARKWCWIVCDYALDWSSYAARWLEEDAAAFIADSLIRNRWSVFIWRSRPAIEETVVGIYWRISWRLYTKRAWLIYCCAQANVIKSVEEHYLKKLAHFGRD